MQKQEAILALREMADLLEITDASRFEYMAFRNAGQSLEEWEGDLAEASKNESLTEIPDR